MFNITKNTLETSNGFGLLSFENDTYKYKLRYTGDYLADKENKSIKLDYVTVTCKIKKANSPCMPILTLVNGQIVFDTNSISGLMDYKLYKATLLDMKTAYEQIGEFSKIIYEYFAKYTG